MIEGLAYGEVVPFVNLAELLPDDSEAAALVRATRGDLLLEQQLNESYLRVLPQSQWDENLRLAAHSETTMAAEWVTFLPGHNGDLGVSLPDDSSPVRRLSLFSQLGSSVRRMSIERVRGDPWSISLSVSGGHCDLPDRGTCDPGRCGGCILRIREGPHRGLICACSHPEGRRFAR